MSSSYKTCYRRNVVLQHAHSKQSNSLDNRLSSSTRSIDSDVQKLQKQLMGYKVRQSQCTPSPTCSTCSSPNSGNILSARVKMLKGGTGDMVYSAPDITCLFSRPEHQTPPTSPRGPRERTSSGSQVKCPSSLTLGEPAGNAITDRRGSLDSRRRSHDQKKLVSPAHHHDLRRVVQESPLLNRRRATSPDTMLPPCSFLDRQTSGSNTSLAPPPLELEEDEKTTDQWSPLSQSSSCNDNEDCRRHSKPKLVKKRSKSFDQGIKTVEDITRFFNKLRGTETIKKSPTDVAKMMKDDKDMKDFSLPEIKPRYKNNKGKLLPALIVTTVEEQ